MAHPAGDYPGFRSMKRPGVFVLPPGWDASPSQGYPQHCESKVSCPRTQHNVLGQGSGDEPLHFPCYVNAFLLYLFQGHQSHPQGLVCTGQHCSNITAASWTDSKKLIKITSRLKSKFINLFKTIIILLVKKTMKQLERRLADLYIVSNYNL